MKQRDYNPDRYTRKSLRLPDRDYASAGAYFVTIRGMKPDSLFEIPQLRSILRDTWLALPERFSCVKLDEFVIMPDHIHFILWLSNEQTKRVTLGNVVGAYKSITTVQWIKYLKSVGEDMKYPCRIWQERYYDRVVRMDELERIRLYVRNNPKKLQQNDDQTQNNV